MHRFVVGVVVVLALTACTPASVSNLQDVFVQTAWQQLGKTLAPRFTQDISRGVGVVVDELAAPGGYLDNPLVRILLPPPTGMILDLARGMDANPNASLLEQLMNAAAEQAIPGAAPILRAALTQFTPATAQALLAGDPTAATEFLKAATADAVLAAVTPSVSTMLGESGAQLLYAELLDIYRAQAVSDVPEAEMAADNTMVDLSQYVAKQAVEGLFRSLAAKETQIRERLDQATGGIMQARAGRSFLPVLRAR